MVAVDNKKSILFIVNPISGARGKINLEEILPNIIDAKRFQYEIYYTTQKGDATKKAKSAVIKGTEIVVAVGGDGTINEVAQGLVNSNSSLAVVPNGSGNGFANYFNISLNPTVSITKLAALDTRIIDTATFNDQLFLSIAGLGFDAKVAHAFDQYGKRGFISYLLLTIKEYFHFKASKYTVVLDGHKSSHEAFLITAANSRQFGNNAFIAPNAVIDDGLLDLVILKPFKPWHILTIGFRLFNKTIHKSKYCTTLQAKEIVISTTDQSAQIDGEPILSKATNKIKIYPASLKMIV